MPRPSQIDPRERALVLKLRDERVKQDRSATELAESIGISRSTITHLESDDSRPTLWVLLTMADGLGFEVNISLRKRKKPKGQKKSGK